LEGGFGIAPSTCSKVSSYIFVVVEWTESPFVIQRGNIDRDSVILT
jgi:hypothetical protein